MARWVGCDDLLWLSHVLYTPEPESRVSFLVTPWVSLWAPMKKRRKEWILKKLPQMSITNHQLAPYDLAEVEFLQCKSSDEEQTDIISPGMWRQMSAMLKTEKDLLETGNAFWYPDSADWHLFYFYFSYQNDTDIYSISPGSFGRVHRSMYPVQCKHRKGGGIA